MTSGKRIASLPDAEAIISRNDLRVPVDTSGDGTGVEKGE
jgi:hypothetical protein